ncbi:MAG TPA: HAMP domain-containing sensor histidine kinase [Vicinamibacterales bacterium]|nr:HAMP domain-containing sensor histidine kinase [Vicinamibacterales bacterium]
MPDTFVPSATPPRPRPRWYRSLYWRIGIAVIALVALMLAAEGALFLWLSDRTAGAMPGRSPQQMVRLVAQDFEAALSTEPSLDLEKYLREQYGHYFQTILVIMRDGRVIANHDDTSAEDIRLAAQMARSFGPRPGRWRGGPGDGPGGPGFGPERGDGRGPRLPDRDGRGPELGPGAGPDGRGDARRDPSDSGRFDASAPDDGLDARRRRGPPPPFGELASIYVAGMRIGTVALMTGDPPFSRILRLVGPTMGFVAGGVLIVGGSFIALLVFAPARKRLQQVQDATERLGGGDLLARAPEQGGDEVAALAFSFNRMADELTRRAQALESSDKARRQLLADVSHELMTPLTAMRGYIETLGMPDLPLDPPTRERYMRIVTEETHRLEHIIGDLLDLARLEGGGTTMRRERVPVEMLFDRVAERHERELSSRHIQLAPSLGAGAEEVMGDPERLEQALQNLVANALRYTPDEGRISLATERANGDVRIIVRDSGPGIPGDHLPHIFDRFYKVDASRKAAAGSGLGLSIVKAIIERHGGTITARNDGGAVFEIILPRA